MAYASDDLDLKSMGAWYLTLIAANNNAGAGAILEKLKEAVGYGYKNPGEIQTADQLIPLRDNDTFKKLVADLWEIVRAEARTAFQSSMESELARAKERTETGDVLGLGELTDLAGAQFWRPGKLTVLVLTRVHHDGFHKLLPTLDAAFQAHAGDRVAGALIYYQFDAANSGRKEQTRHEVDRLGVKWPVAVIDQKQKDAIEETLRGLKESETDPLYFPATVFLDPTGTPVLARKGLLLDWQVELLFARMTPLLGAAPAESSSPLVDATEAAKGAAEVAEKAASAAKTAALKAREVAEEAVPPVAEAAGETANGTTDAVEEAAKTTAAGETPPAENP